MIIALFLLAAVSVSAQDVPPTPVSLPTVSGTATALPTVSGTAGDILQLVNASAAAKLPDGPWAGKSQLWSLPSVALAQSFTTTDQAVGIHKDLWSLYKGGYEVVRVGAFGGFYKPIFTSNGKGPRSLAGATVLVPGSALDWAMGTNYGEKWLPALKSGILVAYDASRPKALGWSPDFVGALLSYKLGSTAAAK